MPMVLSDLHTEQNTLVLNCTHLCHRSSLWYTVLTWLFQALICSSTSSTSVYLAWLSWSCTSVYPLFFAFLHSFSKVYSCIPYTYLTQYAVRTDIFLVQGYSRTFSGGESADRTQANSQRSCRFWHEFSGPSSLMTYKLLANNKNWYTGLAFKY